MSQEVSTWLGSMGYKLFLNGVYWGYKPLTYHLLTSWDIQALDFGVETNLGFVFCLFDF